ncbi:MAG TPA: ATP synthase subunit I [Terriglobales bacterium]|nr:ATP synthase subunit I [Terriglobales bacterium]
MESDTPIGDQVPPDERLTDPILAAPDPATDAFLARAYWRMQTTIAVLGIAGTAIIALTLGWRNGIGFLLGASLAYLNFRWLKQSILALTDRISAQETIPQGRAVVFKFIFRYLVVATVGYAIISSSTINVLSVIAGFFLSVAALLMEAVTEVAYGLRHGD